MPPCNLLSDTTVRDTWVFLFAKSPHPMSRHLALSPNASSLQAKGTKGQFPKSFFYCPFPSSPETDFTFIATPPPTPPLTLRFSPKKRRHRWRTAVTYTELAPQACYEPPDGCSDLSDFVPDHPCQQWRWPQRKSPALLRRPPATRRSRPRKSLEDSDLAGLRHLASPHPHRPPV